MKRSILWGGLALLALAPGAASSQVAVRAEDAAKAARAELLTEQAYLIAVQGHDFATAASWLREAAELNGPGEATVRALMDAGHFHFYARRSLDAVAAFQDAGRLAVDLRDFETAARAFRNGAFAADRAGDLATARQLKVRSELFEVAPAVDRGVAVASRDR